MKTKIVLALILGLGSLAQGQITLTFLETDNGNDLTITAIGTLQVDLTASTTDTRTHLITEDVVTQRIESANGNWSYYTAPSLLTLSGAPPPISDELTVIGTPSGDDFGYIWKYGLNNESSYVSGPLGAQAGQLISGSITFDNFNFDLAGLTEGTSGNFAIGPQEYSWSVGSVSAVPEPSTYAAIAFGVLGMVFVARRKIVR